MYGPDCCYHHGPSFYAAKQPYPAVLPPAQPFFASAWLCGICSIKGLCVKLQPGVNRELKSRKIFVTAVCPGPVRTEFFDIAQTTGEIPLYKKLVMADPGKVVAKAIRDSIAGREVSVYGIWMKVFWVLAKVFPHSMILDIMEKIEYAPGKERW